MKSVDEEPGVKFCETVVGDAKIGTFDLGSVFLTDDSSFRVKKDLNKRKLLPGTSPQ